MTERTDITAVVVEDRGIAPIEEYLSPEQWLMSLPAATTIKSILDSLNSAVLDVVPPPAT